MPRETQSSQAAHATPVSDAATSLQSGRRRVLKAAAATALGVIGAPAIVRAQSAPPIRVGFWPVASGLPFFAAIDKGYFKEAGLNVQAQKFASPQQVTEAILAGRSEGSASGTASAALAIGEIAQPGLVKIFCANPSNAKYVLDEFLVAKDSPIQSIAQLKGKKIGCGPGVQNVLMAKTVLERAGATGATVVELPIGQHVAAIAAGQIEACYTLEPTGTIGRLNGATRTLEVGVIAKYLLGDPMAPWFGGSASLSSEFIAKHPDVARKYIAAYRRGVELVQKNLPEARASLKGYTAIEGALTAEVPMVDYVFSTEFKPSDVAYFQKYFDLFAEKGIFSKRVLVDSMLYKG
ncbi:ABC transporter substrate-binding protein [Cupriavidus gilardii]|uniref:ABC transporter substrate-binding protein n=1 Tax=Cupriavidus gilardii TaxID=82541 RepID=UPI001EE5C30D|nr:ABC transporter substrate-binding protein [Cupriavidus gilardii]MCG5258725.1 ABC transporter substrate-binding protein [Cupriavidus gilardii]MDF9429243.1 ABC transporter substrate-binding protein [Cupriavidus gilardii]